MEQTTENEMKWLGLALFHFAQIWLGQNPMSKHSIVIFGGRKQFFVFCSFAVLGEIYLNWSLFSSFAILHGVSMKIGSDCNTIISKMFRFYFVVCFCLLSVCQSCRLIVPAELLNGCIFDPMIVSVSHAGFSINRDNCNTAIAKHIFAEQPLVYYGRAKSVGCSDGI